jgi:hypothetical protein
MTGSPFHAGPETPPTPFPNAQVVVENLASEGGSVRGVSSTVEKIGKRVLVCHHERQGPADPQTLHVVVSFDLAGKFRSMTTEQHPTSLSGSFGACVFDALMRAFREAPEKGTQLVKFDLKLVRGKT